LGQIKVADPVGHERCELLLVVRDAGGQRGDVPVNVAVTLLAAKTQQVETLGRDD
jgi:hypothetical protein